jgi:hypothetical protein
MSDYVDFWKRERFLRLESGLNPELVRECVREIKAMANHREPEYQLPADSFVEFHVREILLKAKQYAEQGEL